METLSLATTLRKQQQKYKRQMTHMQRLEKHNVLHKYQDHYIFYKLQKQIISKFSIILPVRANFSSTLWSVFYVKS